MSLKVSDGVCPAERAEPGFTRCQLPTFLWVQPKKIPVSQNQIHDLLQFLSWKTCSQRWIIYFSNCLGHSLKLPDCMITRVISWHGWWRLSHSRKHPRCLFPNAEIYSSSFELFLQESFQFCGSHYKTRKFNCFRKPAELSGKCLRLSDPQAEHLFFCRAGAKQRSSWVLVKPKRLNAKSSASSLSE